MRLKTSSEKFTWNLINPRNYPLLAFNDFVLYILIAFDRYFTWERETMGVQMNSRWSS